MENLYNCTTLGRTGNDALAIKLPLALPWIHVKKTVLAPLLALSREENLARKAPRCRHELGKRPTTPQSFAIRPWSRKSAFSCRFRLFVCVFSPRFRCLFFGSIAGKAGKQSKRLCVVRQRVSRSDRSIAAAVIVRSHKWFQIFHEKSVRKCLVSLPIALLFILGSCEIVRMHSRKHKGFMNQCVVVRVEFGLWTTPRRTAESPPAHSG